MSPALAIRRCRRRIGLVFAAAIILITIGACSTGAPSLDQPEATVAAPTATAAG
jgi:hypothetical protein